MLRYARWLSQWLCVVIDNSLKHVYLVDKNHYCLLTHGFVAELEEYFSAFRPVCLVLKCPLNIPSLWSNEVK